MARANTPTVKRILREASELANHPSPDIHAAPLSDTNLFEWHFTLRGPSPLPLSRTYPLRPPSFRFLTPSGRFEVNREICLSISGHHEETWQPAWGIRTALVAIRAFMDAPVEGAVGGLECSDEGRRELAGRSRAWVCRDCATARGEGQRTNEEVLEAEKKRWIEMGGDKKGEGGSEEEEKVPEELRLAYRDDLSGSGSRTPATGGSSSSSTSQQPPYQQTPTTQPPPPTSSSSSTSAPASTNPTPTIPLPSTTTPPALRHRHVPQQNPPVPFHQPVQPVQPQQRNQTTTLDRLILFLIFLLLGLVWRKLGKVELVTMY
ncbi:ubiquitin-conjugating enzyme/RWD-like protein [Kalaharituber pfeilii]|nr:ubiquitin-conjugating enzyme/RWD-like protein [Kalaharituber pfeilii]